MIIKYHIFFVFLLFVVQGVVAQIIEPPTINSVTIEPSAEYPGAVRLYWLPSPTDGVTGYILYKYIKDENHDGYLTVTEDLSVNDYTYLDITANADLKSESYYMASYINDKLNYGLPCPPHQTIYLHDIVCDSCKMTNTLTWNHYSGWGSGVYYNIINADDGGIIESGVSDSVFVHNNIQPDTEYQYQIRAVNSDNPSIKSLSNITSITTVSVSKPNPLLFYIENINNYGASVEITASIDSDADLLSHSLMVSNDNINFNEVDYEVLDENTTSVALSHADGNQPKFYNVGAVNVCYDTLFTNTVKPIVLEAASDETDVSIKWNSSYIESSENYTVIVKVDGASPIVQIPPAGLEANYSFDELGDETSEVFCFIIEAIDINGNTSYSNEVCVSRIPKVEFPNAFTPNRDGLNDTFGPFSNYIKNAIVDEFKLIIYDKYGGSIFSTNSSDDSWGGRANGGKPVTEGGYIYYLWFKTSQQKVFEQSGSISVVFP